MSGNINNEATITIIADNGANNENGLEQRFLIEDADVVLEGGGTIEFGGPETGIEFLGESSSLVNDTTIRGSGFIGRIFGSGAVPFAQTGNLEVVGGELTLGQVDLDNAGGSIFVEPDGILELSASTINGGTLAAAPGSSLFGNSTSEQSFDRHH